MADRTVVYTVPQKVLDDSRTFMFNAGLNGNEGTGLWIGRPTPEGATITRFFAPEQIATRTIFGVSVDLTPRAHLTLIDNLQPGERFFVRIHSHPTRAYHSEKDDANPILTHEGAISIVVPNFAKQPIDLARCAIYRLRHGKGWLQLSPQEVQATLKVVP